MSTRQMAEHYRAPQFHGGGGGGLLPYITGNQPRQLQAQQFGHEKEMQKMLQEHNTAMQKLESEAADKIQASKAFQTYAEKNNINPDERKGKIINMLRQNKEFSLANEGAAELHPDVTDATKQGRVASLLAPVVANAKNLELNAPAGSVVSRPSTPLDTGAPVTARGATQNPMSIMPSKFLPTTDESGKIIQGPAMEYSSVGGGQSPGSLSVPPQIRSAALGVSGQANTGAGDLLPPSGGNGLMPNGIPGQFKFGGPTVGDVQPNVAPTPANQQTITKPPGGDLLPNTGGNAHSIGILEALKALFKNANQGQPDENGKLPIQYPGMLMN